MLSSVEQAFVGREEIRAPLKTPAWEAMVLVTISVFVVYFYINVKSQVSLVPLGSLGLSGRSRDRIPYQATEYFLCSLDKFYCFIFIVILLPYSVAALWK